MTLTATGIFKGYLHRDRRIIPRRGAVVFERSMDEGLKRLRPILPIDRGDSVTRIGLVFIRQLGVRMVLAIGVIADHSDAVSRGWLHAIIDRTAYCCHAALCLFLKCLRILAEPVPATGFGVLSPQPWCRPNFADLYPAQKVGEASAVISICVGQHEGRKIGLASAVLGEHLHETVDHGRNRRAFFACHRQVAEVYLHDMRFVYDDRRAVSVTYRPKDQALIRRFLVHTFLSSSRLPHRPQPSGML